MESLCSQFIMIILLILSMSSFSTLSVWQMSWMRAVIEGGIFEIRIITFRCSGRVQLEVAILMKWEQIFSMVKDGSEFPGMDVFIVPVNSWKMAAIPGFPYSAAIPSHIVRATSEV